MLNYTLDPEEEEILEAFDSEELHPIPNANEEIKKHQQYAAETLKREQDIKVRIASRDLSIIQELASIEGISDSMFIAGVLHQFVEEKSSENT